ncbi:hypothetical protein ACNKHW_25605 [Shigella flexneri]
MPYLPGLLSFREIPCACPPGKS